MFQMLQHLRKQCNHKHTLIIFPSTALLLYILIYKLLLKFANPYAIIFISALNIAYKKEMPGINLAFLIYLYFESVDDVILESRKMFERQDQSSSEKAAAVINYAIVDRAKHIYIHISQIKIMKLD